MKIFLRPRTVRSKLTPSRLPHTEDFLKVTKYLLMRMTLSRAEKEETAFKDKVATSKQNETK